MTEITDTEMIDFLEEINRKKLYSSRCVFRLSRSGRGWRLHESSHPDGKSTVREAITDAMKKGYR